MSFIYNPINVPAPPRHTKIQNYRCLSCAHFATCSLREDYAKAAQLIENIIGNPNNSYEVRPEDGSFVGLPFPNPQDYFPAEIQFNDETTGNFLSAKYTNKNFIRVLYEINRFYYQFIFFWIDTNKYEVSKGYELYYGLEIERPSAAAQEISTALLEWRREMEEEEEASKEKDLINTTYFSALLNCDFYSYTKEPIKSLLPETDECADLYHLATYHCEPHKVGELKPKIAPVPYLYPVFIPKPPKPFKCKKTWKREDQENN